MTVEQPMPVGGWPAVRFPASFMTDRGLLVWDGHRLVLRHATGASLLVRSGGPGHIAVTCATQVSIRVAGAEHRGPITLDAAAATRFVRFAYALANATGRVDMMMSAMPVRRTVGVGRSGIHAA